MQDPMSSTEEMTRGGSEKGYGGITEGIEGFATNLELNFLQLSNLLVTICPSGQYHLELRTTNFLYSNAFFTQIHCPTNKGGSLCY